MLYFFLMRLGKRKGIIFLSLAVAGFISILVVVGFLGYIAYKTDQEWSPILETRLKERSQIHSIRVMAQDSSGQEKWLGSITHGRREERVFAKLSEIPPTLVQAIVVLEDPRFLSHEGFDWKGILRAALKNILALRKVEGASTITQQLVKNVFLTSEKKYSRKFKEIVLATLLENRFRKDEILEAYLNEVYLGQLGSVEIHGVARAAQFYFAKPLNELEVHESALLAAMIASPGLFSPWKNKERSLQRRNKVLLLLKNKNFIIEKERELASQKPLPQSSPLLAQTRSGYYIDALTSELSKQTDEKDLLLGNYDLKVPLRVDLQELAEKTLTDFSSKQDANQQAVILVARTLDCKVVAYAGGTDYRKTQLDRIRQSQRPIGSTVKPLLLWSLLAEDDPVVDLTTIVEDAPLTWIYDKQKWSPVNYDKKYRGSVTVENIIQDSLNVPFVRIFHDLKDKSYLENISFLKTLGLSPPEKSTPSILLGAIEARPWDLMNAYLKLARGTFEENCEISLLNEKEIPLTETPESKVLPEITEPAKLVHQAMQKSLREGTSRALGKDLPLDQVWMAKTGTSSDQKDSWYVIFNRDYVALSWTGRDDNKASPYTGASGAMPLLRPIVLNLSKQMTQN